MNTGSSAVHISEDAVLNSEEIGTASVRRTPADWPVELQFLACCARTEIDDETADRIAELGKLVDWRTVVRLAVYHRVLPLLYQSTRGECADSMPENVEAFFRRDYLTVAALNLRLADELHRVRRHLEGGGVEAIFFKGSVLAEFAYRSLGLRACGDIDFLIREEHFFAAENLLREFGYRPLKTVTAEGEIDPDALRIRAQCPFVHEGFPWSLDVHTSMMPPGYSFRLSFDTLYARSVGVSLAGEEVRSFRSEDLLQILCLHGVKNRWERLKHVCDVAELIRSQPDLDWDEVLRTARSVRGERILYVGLELARGLLDASLPPTVVNRMEADPRVGELVERVESYLVRSHAEPLGDKERLKFHMQIQDTLISKARYGFFLIRRRLRDR